MTTDAAFRLHIATLVAAFWREHRAKIKEWSA